ncbi:hypothetical protein QCA50_021041 [Cerrena zonata]|uniref:F-box protein n=1 Tax=Cerrena zonata TaxID=2478898 RepID=A0AAW0FFI6_9APHY
MMRTCRTLYNAGAPIILAEVKLRGNPRHIKSFNSFMLRNLLFRCSFLRELTLRSPKNWSQDVSSERFKSESRILEDFAEIIKGCQNLRHLVLMSSEEWITMHCSIGCAFASLYDLPSVLVDGGGEYTTEVLRLWEHGLKSLCISFDGLETNDRNTQGDPRPLIHNLRNLKELHVKFLDFQPEHDTMEHHLETLSIELWFPAEIDPLVRSFPQLRNLHFRPLADYNAQEDDVTIAATRENNLILQGDLHWKILSYYAGDVIGLYMLAPQCPISHLDIYLDECPQHFHEIFRDAMPSRLTLRIEDTITPSMLTTSMPSPMELPIPLTHAQLYVETLYHHGTISLEDSLRSLFTFIGNIGSKLTALMVEWSDLRSGPDDTDTLVRFWGNFRNMSPTSLAYDVVRNTKILKYLILHIPFQERALYWKVERAHPDATVILTPLITTEEIDIAKGEFSEVTCGLDRFNRFDF